MVDQSFFRAWPAGVQRLLQRIQNEVGLHRTAHAPAHNASGKDVDDEGYIKPALPGRDIGVSRPQEFHLRPLAEPDVSLSTHPAPIIQPWEHIPTSSARRPLETSAQVARELAELALYAEPDVCTCASTSASGTHSSASTRQTSPTHRIDRNTDASPGGSD